MHSEIKEKNTKENKNNFFKFLLCLLNSTVNRKMIRYKNSRVQKTDSLYMDARKADVYFVFNADSRPEKIPAHKLILSHENLVFDAMFYGPMKIESSDIPILDVSAEAFKEFLQFFYMDNVRLTVKNIDHVSNLCRKYKMNDGLMVCEKFQCSRNMNDSMCDYIGALFLHPKHMINVHEQKIGQNPNELMKSPLFLNCSLNVLAKFLKLVLRVWSPVETVIGCMEWGKAECARKRIQASPRNLRNQFGTVFNLIPFDELTLEQFSQYIVTYKSFFSTEEVETLNQIILQQNQQLITFDQQLLQQSDSELVMQ